MANITSARWAVLPDSSTTRDGQGVTPVTKLQTVSAWCGKGQLRTKPHSDRSAKVGQAWGRHAVRETVQACSILTRELIAITIMGGPIACPKCGRVPVWDSEGNLVCNCKIWTDPDSTQKPGRSPDTAIEQEKRNQNYQSQLRKFFKRGRC